MSKLFSQMDAVCHRFEELSVRLNQPETAADSALFRRLMQEYREAEPVVQAYQALTTARDHLAQARALLEGGGPLSRTSRKWYSRNSAKKKSGSGTAGK